MRNAPPRPDIPADVRLIRLDDGPWAWNDGVTGNSGLPTEAAAAQDAQKARSSCRS